MKKLLMIVVIILLLALLTLTITSKLNIGGLSILGIGEISRKDNQLKTTIQEATKVASTDYENKIKQLNEEIKKFEAEKKKYNELTTVSTDAEVAEATQTSEYKIEYLWVRIGNHAKSEGVVIKLEVATSSSGADDAYNLNFTVTGSYINIADFITDIEEDSKLGFKIEEFNMTSVENEQQATFVCKDIRIEGISNNNDSSTEEDVTEETNEIDTNNTTDINTKKIINTITDTIR